MTLTEQIDKINPNILRELRNEPFNDFELIGFLRQYLESKDCYIAINPTMSRAEITWTGSILIEKEWLYFPKNYSSRLEAEKTMIIKALNLL